MRGSGRLVAMVLGLAVALVLAFAGEARAGFYTVGQCGWGVGAELDPSVPTAEGATFSLNTASCVPPPGSGLPGMRFEGGAVAPGSLGVARARWVAPPGTRISFVHLLWSGFAEGGDWKAVGVDVGSEFQAFAIATGASEQAEIDQPVAEPAWAFEAFLHCWAGALGCISSGQSTMRISELILTLEDTQPPTAQLGGPLLASGWHRGTATLGLDSSDVGSGVAGEAATIDGAPVLSAASTCAVATIAGGPRGTKLVPCPPTASQSVEVDTTRLADGVHTVHGCATDFAGDQGCAPDAEFEVDNSPPATGFVAAAEGEVSARVSDPYSGPASGTLSMRRSSATAWTALPTDFDPDGDGTATLAARLPELGAGTWFFRADDADAAGNVGAAELRVSGSAAEVRHQIAVGGGAASRSAGGSGGGGAKESPGAPAPSPNAHRATRLTARLLAVGGAPALTGRTPHGSHATARDAAILIGPSPRGLQATAGGGANPTDRKTRGSRAVARRRSDGGGVSVEYGAAAKLEGRLTEARGGDGIGGKAVLVVVRGAPGSGGTPERHRVRTDGSGRFALRLAPGTSRHVTVSFHGGGGFAPAPRRSLALRVRAAVTLAAEPTELATGESVRLRGHVSLGPARLPAHGRPVAIEYLEQASGRWRPALSVRTDAKGHFDTSYRFRYVTGLARIRLRATVPAEADWPYARGSSAPVTVTVHGR
jgi:hypothetical protein